MGKRLFYKDSDSYIRQCIHNINIKIDKLTLDEMIKLRDKDDHLNSFLQEFFIPDITIGEIEEEQDNDSVCDDEIIINLVINFSGDITALEYAYGIVSIINNIKLENKSIIIPFIYDINDLKLRSEYHKNNRKKESNRLKNNIDNSIRCKNYVNNSLLEQSKNYLNTKIEKKETKSKISEELGIPLKKKQEMPNLVEKVSLVVRTDNVPSKQSKDEDPYYYIGDDDFDTILSVIRLMALTFESSPKTFKKLGEEDYRFLLLSALNIYYEGGAKGEVFNKNGKTDIYIQEKKQSVFVAECKIWRGPKEMTDAINQLEGYMTWKEEKASLIIFNKGDSKFSVLKEKIPDIIKNSDGFIKEIPMKKNFPNEWRYRMKHNDDQNHEYILHISAFNILNKNE